MSTLSLGFTPWGKIGLQTACEAVETDPRLPLPGLFGWFKGEETGLMNYQSNYEGPIGDMVDYYSLNDRADRLTYLIVASCVASEAVYQSVLPRIAHCSFDYCTAIDFVPKRHRTSSEEIVVSPLRARRRSQQRLSTPPGFCQTGFLTCNFYW